MTFHPRMLVADVHVSDRVVLGRPRLPVYMDVLRTVAARARRHGIHHVDVLGDLLDNQRRIPLDVLLSLLRFFHDNRDISWHWLRGNHESPDRANPEKSIMSLFGPVCHVILGPYRESLPGTELVYMPWYPGPLYLEKLEEVVRGLDKPAYLLTHIGLKEGHVSASNFHPRSKVGVEDLYKIYPWKSVFLGDYHDHQRVGDRPCWYLGAPLAHEFGEKASGTFVLHERHGLIGPDALDAPAFVTWDLEACGPEGLRGYRKTDYNRIRCAASEKAAVQEAFPDAQVVGTDEVEEEGPAPRLVEGDQLPLLMEKYVEYKGLEHRAGELLALGMSLVEKQKGATVA